MTQQINLINPALRKKRDLLTAVPLLSALGVILVALMVVSTLARQEADSIQAEAGKYDAQLKDAQARQQALAVAVDNIKPDPLLEQELATARTMLDLNEEVLGILEGGSLGASKGFAEFMRGFARQVPDALWLTGFSMNSTTGDMEVRGRMLKSTALPQYIQRLNGEPVFQGRSFSSLTMDRPVEKDADNKEQAAAYVEFVMRNVSNVTAMAAAKPVRR